MIDKRYQIFISSTRIDLEEERAAVADAIQRVGYIPAGMELFQAADRAPWDVITTFIDASDYYVVIVAGRYGQIREDDKSWTECEYEYAVSKGVPVLAFEHAEPAKLPADRVDTDEAAVSRLASFRDKLRERHTIQSWKSIPELTNSVLAAIMQAVRTVPRDGWVRGSAASKYTAAVHRIDQLNAEITRLGSENESLRSTNHSKPVRFDPNDSFEILLSRRNSEQHADSSGVGEERAISITLRWEEAFRVIAWPAASGESESGLVNILCKKLLADRVPEDYQLTDRWAVWRVVGPRFAALDLIEAKNEVRPDGDLLSRFASRRVGAGPGGEVSTTIWYLTGRGKAYLTSLQDLSSSEETKP